MRISVQSPSAVIMVRPHRFSVNTETAADNAFQSTVVTDPDHAVLAREEISAAAKTLRAAGVTVHLFEDRSGNSPDSVFPNNWFSTHAGGHIAVYPMKAENRRLERRQDVIEFLKTHYRVQDVIDYSGLEQDGLYLEGTGAMVLDHMDRVAYAAESDRTNPVILERFCTHFNFEPMTFAAADSAGRAIYHTNVLMSVGTGYALVGTSLIRNLSRRDEIVSRLRRTGRDVVELSEFQIARFAGNALELQGRNGAVLAISTTALKALTEEQMRRLEAVAELVPIHIPTIELAGGSVRCTLAGIHLMPRDPG